MRRFLSFGPAFVVLLTAAVTLLVIPGAIRNINAAQTHVAVAVAQASLDEDDALDRLNRAVRNIATAVEPSVVHLEVYNGTGRGRNAVRGSSGSGWIYDHEGHVVTNAHVVSGSNDVLVQFFDGHVAKGTVVGLDVVSDIAVLRVDSGTHLEPARRGTGLRLERGDRVYAFGSPFGFKFSMSEGIVSGLGRSARTMMMGGAGISNFIQTDAAVNPGNSGGPLVDAHGRVVGMNVAIATAQNTGGSSEGQSAGISFAIPLPVIESRVDQLIAGTPISSGFLGVGFGGTSDGRGGLRLSMVSPGGAADKAGLKVGDVVTSIDGEPVSERSQAQSLIRSARPGQTIAIRVLRDDQEVEVHATLGEAPLQQVRAMLLEEFGLALADTAQGPTVSFGIDDASPAGLSGFKVGQVIGDVGGEPVKSVADVISRLQAHGLFSGAAVKVQVVETTDSDAIKRELNFRLIPQAP